MTQTWHRPEPIGCGSNQSSSVRCKDRPCGSKCPVPNGRRCHPQSNNRDCAKTRRSALRALSYRNKYRDRHLREQGSRCASEQEFPQPRVTIGSEHEQVRSAPPACAKFTSAIGEPFDITRSTLRCTLCRANCKAMSAPGSSPCRRPLDGSTTSVVTACASTRNGIASDIARRAFRLAFQPIRTLLPIASPSHALGRTSSGAPLASKIVSSVRSSGRPFGSGCPTITRSE